MEPLILLVLAIPVGILVLLIWLVTRVVALGRQIDRVQERTNELQWRFDGMAADLKREREESAATAVPPTAAPAQAPVSSPATLERLLAKTPPKPEIVLVPTLPTPPPIPQPLVTTQAPPVVEPTPKPLLATPVSTAPKAAPSVFQPPVRSTPKPAFNFEQFLGVKLFAWLGGLVLFLAVAFFIKYSFDHNLVSPQLRVAGALLLGLGLIVGGLKLSREHYNVTVQTLCAAGVLVLYADIFAAHVYFKLIASSEATFGLMVLVTAVAFMLAVRLDAQVVAVLGLLGGFLTPVLLSTGRDNPLGLFTYLGILDVGLVAVALRKRWPHLVLLAAVATVVMEFGWVNKFFAVEKCLTAMTVFLFFSALFLAAFALAQKRLAHGPDEVEANTAVAAILMPMATLLFAFYLLVRPYRDIAGSPVSFFIFVFLADIALLATAWMRTKLRAVQLAGGAAVFLLLSIWTQGYLTDELLNPALALYFVFAVLHSLFPVVLQRLQPGHLPSWWAHLFPSLALLLVLFPMFKLPTPSFLLWPVVLLIDGLALLLAVLTMSLSAVASVLILTALATAIWIFRVPVVVDGWLGLPGMLLIIGGFALLFFFFGAYALKKLAPRLATLLPGSESKLTEEKPGPSSREIAMQISCMAAVLPFLLLVMVVVRLPSINPSPVFGLAALMVVLLLGTVRALRADWLSLIALGCTLLLEFVWHRQHFGQPWSNDHGFVVSHWYDPWNLQLVIQLGWYIGFALAFTAFPFVFHRQIQERRVPWVTAALALPAHFPLIYMACKANLPAFGGMGLVPAVCALPTLVGLVWLLKKIKADNPARNTLLALFGGTTLFFITLIFPIQFEKQWLTVAWAMEGTALLWLFHRVPHPGLRVVGVALLCVAFARLAFNPAVFGYHPRSATRIINWYFYSYSLVTVCLFEGARLLQPPRNIVNGKNVLPLLYTLGTVLAFLLLNIEIADYFSTGATLTFKFSGNLARDMTYSLAWALFALVLLMIGFRKRITGARRAGMGLMVVTLLKLFVHDLWQLGGLYRVGALIGLAAVLILASFIYQKFLASEAKRPEDASNHPSEPGAGE